MRFRRRVVLPFLVLGLLAVTVLGCLWRNGGVQAVRRRMRSGNPNDPSLVLVTGYCNCGKCCGWKRSWFGFGPPVYDYGPMKGKPKKVGVTSSGATAHRGTVAADPRQYPRGTRLLIPGYGEGVVEDIGGSIKGRHIDIWFPTHAEARAWGAQWLKVTTVTTSDATDRTTRSGSPRSAAGAAHSASGRTTRGGNSTSSST